MSHVPPVPTGNQSTYPLKEPPHHHGLATPERGEQPNERDEASARLPILAVASVAGLVAAAVALFLRSRDSAGKAKDKRATRS